MQIAYILINIKPDSEMEVIKQIKDAMKNHIHKNENLQGNYFSHDYIWIIFVAVVLWQRLFNQNFDFKELRLVPYCLFIFQAGISHCF